MESELSGVFGIKLVAKNIVLGSPGTHFMHMRVKVIFFVISLMTSDDVNNDLVPRVMQ